MNPPPWFEEQPVLGALADAEIVEELRALGETSLADELELATEPERGRVLEGHPWSHTGQVAGYLDPADSEKERAPILSPSVLQVDRKLLGKRLRVALTGLGPVSYPGAGVHRLLFHFTAKHVLGQSQRCLHFQVNRLIEEGAPFLRLDQPVFVGLTAGEPGLDLRFLILKVIDTCDQAILDALQLDTWRFGFQLSQLPWPAAELVSELAFRATSKVRSGQPTIHEGRLGLDIAAEEKGAPLRTGSYVCAQIPAEEQVDWSWKEWCFLPQNGQIFRKDRLEERFPFNYLLVTVQAGLG